MAKFHQLIQYFTYSHLCIQNQEFFMPLNIPLDLVTWNHMSMKINKTNVNKGIQSTFTANEYVCNIN